MKTYIASPFFVEHQRKNVEIIRKQILDLGIEVFSPMHDGILLTKGSGDRALKNAYLGDIGGVRDADFITAIMDYDDVNYSGDLYGDKKEIDKNRRFFGFDSGTIFEIGVAKGMGIPIIYYIPSNVKLNLMLVMAGRGFTTNIMQIGNLIRDVILENKPFIKEKYVKETLFEDKGIRYI
jgi:nucleoside 2-deoxyribosyltransferase